MSIQKANWARNGQEISISMPFEKTNKSKRTVAGFATVDNADTQNDIVTSTASINAFEKFRGNVREMHQPKAVGKITSFAPETLYDETSGVYYSGIFVEARISKGAQDTWEKVLDGTLSGFSIGGKVVDSEVAWNEELQKTVQIVKEMELYELSLVDNPANPFANVVSIQKFSDSAPVTEKVFSCPNCKIAISAMTESKTCPQCSQKMNNIGWIERASIINKEIKKIVDDHYTSDKASEINPLPETDEKNSEGEINMDDHIEEPVAEISEEQPSAEIEEVSTDVEVSDEGEAPAGAEDSESDWDKITARLSDLQEKLEQIVAAFDANEKTAQEAVSVSKALEEKIDGFQAKVTEIEDKITKSISSISESVSDVEAKIEKVADATATKKSGDLGSEPEIKKGLWEGHFLGINSLGGE
jgi:HK97 family phage prohead protease